MGYKYEILKNTATRKRYGRTLYRIRALRDIPLYNVKAGDLGGWVEGEHNLSQGGKGWIEGDATVYEDAHVSGDALIADRAVVGGAAIVDGCTQVTCNAYVSGHAKISGRASVNGNARVTDHAEVSGAAFLIGSVMVCGHATVCGEIDLGGNIQIGDEAILETQHDYFHACPVASADCHLYLYRTRTGYSLRIGCWEGTLPELKEIITSEYWPSGCDRATREKYRPQLQAVIGLCEWYVDQWKSERTKEAE